MSYEGRQKADLARGQCHAPQTDSMGHWAKGIRRAWIKRDNHTHRPVVRGTIADGLKETRPGTLFNLQDTISLQRLQLYRLQENSSTLTDCSTTWTEVEISSDFFKTVPCAPVTPSSIGQATTGLSGTLHIWSFSYSFYQRKGVCTNDSNSNSNWNIVQWFPEKHFDAIFPFEDLLK